MKLNVMKNTKDNLQINNTETRLMDNPIANKYKNKNNESYQKIKPKKNLVND